MRCDDCGFEYGSIPTARVPDRLRQLGPSFGTVLAGPDAGVRDRPAPEVWSSLEYACHVRDVLLTLRERIILALWWDTPTFRPMGRDERVAFDRYAEQSPADVARQLADAASMLAFLVEGLTDDQLARTCVYGFPESEVRTLAWVAEHAVHEGEHHLRDAAP